MHMFDYVRLSNATIRTHKKRAIMVILISSLPLMLLVTIIFLIQGLENSLLAATLTPVDGKIILSTSVDLDYCQSEPCNAQEELTNIQQNIVAYGGQILDAHLKIDEVGTFLQIPDLAVNSPKDDNISYIAMPIEAAAKLVDLELPKLNADPAAKLTTVKTIQESLLHKTITTSQGQMYHLVNLLPSDYFLHNLSLSNVNQDNNPLNLILANSHTAGSVNLMLNSPNYLNSPSINITENNTILAKFSNLDSATNYFYSPPNYCSENDRLLQNCPAHYRYQVSQPIGRPIDVQHSFQQIWAALTPIILIISTVEAIVTVTTYLRLIDKETKTISLYYAMGARKAQIIGLYFTYLLILSVFAVILSSVGGLTIATIVSILNADSLSQIFTLAFATTVAPFSLVGWNNSILIINGIILTTVPLSILLSINTLSSKRLY